MSPNQRLAHQALLRLPAWDLVQRASQAGGKVRSIARHFEKTGHLGQKQMAELATWILNHNEGHYARTSVAQIEQCEDRAYSGLDH